MVESMAITPRSWIAGRHAAWYRGQAQAQETSAPRAPPTKPDTRLGSVPRERIAQARATLGPAACASIAGLAFITVLDLVERRPWVAFPTVLLAIVLVGALVYRIWGSLSAG
ncbi:MAG: hypothetical protein DRQ55_12840 [Planctomycetota bacterium]|nr:MAG: hypothetical protein DRQ55_12840 [Planctomycetota bacterium]